MKPWQIWLWNKRPVQVVSHPTPHRMIIVRMIPGDPTTLREVKCNELEIPPIEEADLIERPWKMRVQYAKVSGTGHFPTDMLRKERAFPVDFNLDLQDTKDELMIFRLTKNPREPWNNSRWQSFGWRIEHFGTYEVSCS
jgi:hypothetical protein